MFYVDVPWTPKSIYGNWYLIIIDFNYISVEYDIN